jgi:hypothetical protein
VAAARKTTPAEALRPEAAIRRFDIFAEYQRQQAIKKGTPADQAKGYGLWLAKLVAARRFGRTEKPEGEEDDKKEERRRRRAKWRSLDGKPQTDKLFDKEIVGRMGRDFYRRVFSPAIRDALARGASYESIRDSLRRDWKPR